MQRQASERLSPASAGHSNCWFATTDRPTNSSHSSDLDELEDEDDELVDCFREREAREFEAAASGASELVTAIQNHLQSVANSSHQLQIQSQLQLQFQQQQQREELLPLNLKILPTLWPQGQPDAERHHDQADLDQDGLPNVELIRKVQQQAADAVQKMAFEGHRQQKSKVRSGNSSKGPTTTSISTPTPTPTPTSTCSSTSTSSSSSFSYMSTTTSNQMTTTTASRPTTTTTASGSSSSKQRRLYKCRHCPFETDKKVENWQHIRIHMRPEKLLACEVESCQFVTEYKHHLEYHQRNHSGYKPFKCDSCDYQCVNKSMLNSHMKSHSSVYQYQCGDCKYATKYVHSLKMHLRKYNHQPGQPMIDVYGRKRGPKSNSSSSSSTHETSASAGQSRAQGTSQSQLKQQSPAQQCVLDLRVRTKLSR